MSAKTERSMTLARVKATIKPLPKDTRASVVCSLVGHSRIVTACFGYYNCARCGGLVGDSLAGSYSGANAVVVGHNCERCRENFKTLTWRDTFMSPDPFAASKAS